MMKDRCSKDFKRFGLRLEFATEEADVRAAQKLRFDVFTHELGAKLVSPVAGLDVDPYDGFCEHLLVRDLKDGAVVGTYRILAGQNALTAGGFQAESQFDMARLKGGAGPLMEIGRACVHPNYRTGATVLLLWAGLIEFMERHALDGIFGTAILALGDSLKDAPAMFRELERKHPVPEEWRVFPYHPVPETNEVQEKSPAIPALVKYYLRAGGVLVGTPAWDSAFNCADLPIMVHRSNIGRDVARLFMGDDATPSFGQ